MSTKSEKKHHGLFVVLEGADGSGKTTQLKLLAERLKAVGYDVAIFDFPRYEQPSGHFVQQYLNGAYGPARGVSPFTASLFYALDRFEAAPEIRQALDSGRIVLADRYVGSNMAHQGSKFKNPEQQRGFFVWEDSLEFNLLGVPRPDINLFLKLPPEISQKLMLKRRARNYTAKQLDEHEADSQHLKDASETYESLIRLFPKDFKAIICSAGGKILPIPAISDKIWAVIKPILPEEKPYKAKGVTLKIDAENPRNQAPNKQKITNNLSHQKTNSSDLAEFSLDKVSQQAVNAIYGFEDLELERTLYWPESRAGQPYYALGNLPKALTESYRSGMHKLAVLHKVLSSELERYQASLSKDDAISNESGISFALEAVTPVAAMSRLQINLPSYLIKPMLTKLSLSGNPELIWASKQLQSIAQQKPYVSAGRSGQPEMLSRTIDKLSRAKLNMVGADNNEAVKLISHWPKNEFNLLAEGLYPYASLSQSEINAQIDTWTYDQKQAALQSLIRQPDNLFLDRVHYQWDVILSQIMANEFLKNCRVSDFRRQVTTPRFGYDIPELVITAKAEGPFIEAFDLSLDLYSQFQAAGREDLAVYTTLMGHQVRCQFSLTGLSLAELLQTGSNSEMLNVFKTELRDQAAQVHPTIGSLQDRHAKLKKLAKDQIAA